MKNLEDHMCFVEEQVENLTGAFDLENEYLLEEIRMLEIEKNKTCEDKRGFRRVKCLGNFFHDSGKYDDRRREF